MKLSTFIQKVKYGSNLNKPFYMYKLVSNVFKRRFLGKLPLRGVDFAVDFACNLNCQHCFNKTMIVKGKRKMGLSDYERVIGEAVELGAINFAFQGGEFLIHKDMEKILRLVDSKKYSLSITTNGYLLDEEMMKRLKSLGVNTLTISLDSGLAHEHDEFRGRDGSFVRAVEGIELAREAGIKVVVNSCVTPVSLRSEGFRRLLEFTRDKKLLINTIFAAPCGKWANNDQIILRPEDIRFYYDLVRGHPFVVRDVDSGYARRGCQGGTESIYLTPYGEVLGCPYIHIAVGNVFDESLRLIRQRAIKYFFYQEKCLISENYDFIKEYIDLTKSEEQLPLDASNLEKITNWGRK